MSAPPIIPAKSRPASVRPQRGPRARPDRGGDPAAPEALSAACRRPGWRTLLTTGAIAAGVGLAIVTAGAGAPDLRLAAALLLAGFLCELVDSSLGMGYGTTLAPLLLLAGLDPRSIVPAVLLSEAVTGLLAGLAHHRNGNVDLLRNRVAQRALLTILGVTIVAGSVSAALAVRLPSAWIGPLIGGIVLSVGVVMLLTRRRRLRFRPLHLTVLCGIGAASKGLSGGGFGPLVMSGQVVCGIAPRSAAGITSLAEGVTCLAGLATYALTTGTVDWLVALPLMTGGVLSVPLATRIVRHMDEHRMRTLLGALTCGLGALAIVKSLA